MEHSLAPPRGGEVTTCCSSLVSEDMLLFLRNISEAKENHPWPLS